jgi:hypothetical protein
MFIAAFEKNIECLENRFSQKGLEYYKALQQVLILAASKKNYDTELKKFLGFITMKEAMILMRTY